MMVKLGVALISATKGNNEKKGVLGGEYYDGNRGYGERFCLGIYRRVWGFDRVGFWGFDKVGFWGLY